MPKRQPKPELITPDEVMGSPALQGFDIFLRYRPGEERPDKLQEPIGQSPIGEQPLSIRPPSASPSRSIPIKAQLPIGESPMGKLPIGVPETPGIPVIRPPRKIRRAVKVQDAHSIGEQALYQALWNAAAMELGGDSKLIRIGYGGMQSLCGLDKSNCKDNILSLIKKLAIEVISGFDIRRNEGNTYRVFSYGAILKRRKASGLEWVIRSRGVQFVEQPPVGRTPIGDIGLPIGESPVAPIGNSPPGPMGETPTGPLGKTPIAFRNEVKLQEEEPPSSKLIRGVLRQHLKVVDDAAVLKLVTDCRAVAPDCTEEEIVYFVRAKVEQLSANPSVRSLMGVLGTAVPRCFEGSAFREFRAEQAQKRESKQRERLAAEADTARMLAEQQAILADSNATEDDKRFARQLLGIPESEDEKPDG